MQCNANPFSIFGEVWSEKYLVSLMYLNPETRLQKLALEDAADFVNVVDLNFIIFLFI